MGLRQGVLEGTSFDFMQVIMSIPFARDYDLSKMGSIGFEEKGHGDSIVGWQLAFERMVNAGIVPAPTPAILT